MVDGKMALSKQKRQILRTDFYDFFEREGAMEIRVAIKRMRKFLGKTQAEYAHMIGVSPRVLIDFERGVGNPTLRSIHAMIAPLNLEICVRPQK